ncbi:unnamed protein product, partial [Rotaria sp. Silwood2]
IVIEIYRNAPVHLNTYLLQSSAPLQQDDAQPSLYPDTHTKFCSVRD